MQIHNQTRNRVQLDHPSCFVLCWSVGLSLGLYAGLCASNRISDCLYQATHFIGGLPIGTTILPILLIWFFLWRDLQGLIYPVMFIKAFADGLILIGISRTFGSAAWLFGPLLIASDRIATVIQLWFSSRFLEGKDANLHRSFLLCLSAIVAAIIFDHLIIAPYFISLVP